MDIKIQQHYNCSVEALIDSFFDASYIAKKFTELGNENVDVSFCDRGPSKGKISFSYDAQPSDNMPPALKSFAGGATPLTQTELWKNQNDQWLCEYTVALNGVPVELSGSMCVKATDTGCVNEVSLTVSCPIPILGKMIEEFIEQDSEGQMQAEYQHIKAHLKA